MRQALGKRGEYRLVASLVAIVLIGIAGLGFGPTAMRAVAQAFEQPTIQATPQER